MGPHGTTVRLDRFDATTGGAFRYVVEAPNGGQLVVPRFPTTASPMASSSTLGNTKPSRARLWRPFASPTCLTGRSVLEISSTYTSKEACDAMLASGMDAGMD